MLNNRKRITNIDHTKLLWKPTSFAEQNISYNIVSMSMLIFKVPGFEWDILVMRIRYKFKKLKKNIKIIENE